jgi:hypothetical protein
MIKTMHLSSLLQDNIVKYIPLLYKKVKLYKNCFVDRRPGYGTWTNQKPSSIFQLIDQLENVAEKLLAEYVQF